MSTSFHSIHRWRRSHKRGRYFQQTRQFSTATRVMYGSLRWAARSACFCHKTRVDAVAMWHRLITQWAVNALSGSVLRAVQRTKWAFIRLLRSIVTHRSILDWLTLRIFFLTEKQEIGKCDLLYYCGRLWFDGLTYRKNLKEILMLNFFSWFVLTNSYSSSSYFLERYSYHLDHSF